MICSRLVKSKKCAWKIVCLGVSTPAEVGVTQLQSAANLMIVHVCTPVLVWPFSCFSKRKGSICLAEQFPAQGPWPDFQGTPCTSFELFFSKGHHVPPLKEAFFLIIFMIIVAAVILLGLENGVNHSARLPIKKSQHLFDWASILF